MVDRRAQIRHGAWVELPIMQPAQSQEITVLLRRWSEGDRAAIEEVTPLVYRELRLLADGYLRRERPDHTLQVTELVHEAYLRLVGQKQSFEGRKQFYGVAAHLMRIILVDHARSHGAQKRGSGASKISLDDIDVFSRERGPDLVALDEVLNRLAGIDERKSRAIELRFFGGLSLEEVADTLEVSIPTVVRELRMAQAWLHKELTA